MANSNKEVGLVIKAKNDATRAIDSVADALKGLADVQNDVSKSAAKTDGVIGQLADELSNLNNQAKGLGALGTIALQMDKAARAVGTLESEVAKTGNEIEALAKASTEGQSSTGRLTAQIEHQTNALREQAAASKAAKDAQSAANKVLRSAETVLARLEKRLATAGKPSQKLQDDVASQRETVTALRAAQQAAIQNYEAQASAQKQAASTLRELNGALKDSEANERKVAAAAQDAHAALERQNQALSVARSGLNEISTIAGRASNALGGVAVSQDAIAEASKRSADDIARVTAALDRQKGVIAPGTSKASTTTASSAPDRSVAGYKAQVAAVREAEKAWRDAQAEATRLATAIKATEQPTAALQREFLLAQSASKAAKQEFIAQGVALGQLRNTANGSFAAFETSVRKITEASANAAAASANLASSATRAASAQGAIAPAAQSTAWALHNGAAGAQAFGAALDKNEASGSRATQTMERLRGEVLALAAGYIGLQAAFSQIGGVVNSYQTLEAAQNRLGVVFNQDTGKVGQELGFLREQADRLGISFGSLAGEYSKFAVAAGAANFSNESTRKIFIAVAEAARVNKLSLEDTSGVFLALTQMINKGKVSAEELRQQMGERLPGAFNIFADALGLTTTKLDALMQKGDVLATESNLLKFADELSTRFGPQLAQALDSVTTQIGRLQNNVFNAQIQVAQGGFITGLNDALKQLNAYFESTDGQAFFASLGAATGKFVTVLAQVPQYFDELQVAVSAFVAVKLGSTLSDLVNKFGASTNAVNRYNAEMAFIGPQMERASLAQRIFGQGLAQTVGSLDRLRAGLAASTSSTTTARVGILAFNATLGVARATMISVASVVRGLWAAIGGLPGLILTGLTFAVGSWLTSIESASSALDEHQRQLAAITEGYNSAKKGASDWAKEVNNVTLAQAVRNAEDLKREFREAFSEVVGLGRVLKYGFADFPDTSTQAKQLQQIQTSIKAVEDGDSSLQDLAKILNDIALNPADEQFKQIALQMLDLINNAKDGKQSLLELSDALDKSEAKARLMAGTASDADKALLGLGKAAGEAADETKKGAFSLDKYNEALDKLKDKVPALADQMKRLKEFAEIDSAGLQAFGEAVKSGNIEKIAEALNLYGQAKAAAQQQFDQKQFDQLPDTGKSVIDRIIFVEGGQSGTGPGSSSARGIGQFTEGTWLRFFDRLFPALSQLTDAAKLEYRTNEAYARPMLEALTKQNQMDLANSGISPNNTNTYLAHFLGSGDAIKVLLANPDELASKIVNKDSVAANPTVFKAGTTVQDLINWASQKMGGGSRITSTGATVQENFDDTIDQRIQGYKEEADARRESNREGEIAKALHQAEAEAAKQGATLSKDQAQAIRDATGARYDALHAGEAEKKQKQDEQEAIQNLIGLDQQRRTAVKELQLAMQEGDQGRVAELQQQISDLNAEIAKGLPLAQQLAQALGDEKGIASLQKITLQAKLLNIELTNARQINNMLADGLTNAFSTAAQGIGEAIVGAKSWKDALLGVRNAFLKFAADFLIQIGQMILKQLILNALSSAFGGSKGGIGGLIAGAVNAIVKHDGGIAYAGGASRSVSPMLFANAVRYHNGTAAAGLKSNEIPAILEKGETVRTQAQEAVVQKQLSDGGKATRAAGGESDARSIRNVLLFDPSELAAAMAGPAGEKVLLTLVKRNAATVKRLLK